MSIKSYLKILAVKLFFLREKIARFLFVGKGKIGFARVVGVAQKAPSRLSIFLVGKSHYLWEEYVHFQDKGWLTPLYLFAGLILAGNLFVESLYNPAGSGFLLPETKKQILLRVGDNLKGGFLTELDVEKAFAKEEPLAFQAPRLTTEQSIFAQTDIPTREGRAGKGEALYTVKEGDTLSEIANSFGLKAITLKYVNKLASADNLKPGQVLKIPKEDLSEKQISQILADERKVSVQEKAKSSKQKSKIILTGENKEVDRDSGWITPLSYNYISRGITRGHTGIDYVAPLGTHVYSACSGVVVDVGPFGAYSGGRGNYVSISCGGGITMHYYHLSAYSQYAEPGRELPVGTLLGAVGSTGRSTGPHLHFEVRKNGVPFDPGLR